MSGTRRIGAAWMQHGTHMLLIFGFIRTGLFFLTTITTRSKKPVESGAFGSDGRPGR